MTFGDRLRAEREKRGISLEEIAASTRIRRRHLEALERNDFGELPGAVFSKGFVRAYAVFLGTDPDPLLRAYSRELRVQAPAGTIEPDDPLDELRRVIDRSCAPRKPRASRWLLAGSLVLGVAALAGLGVAMWPERTPGDPPHVASPPVQRVAEPTVTPVVPGASEVIPRAEPVAEAAPSEPIAEPPPVDSAPPPDPAIAIRDFGVGTGVVDRVLVGRSDRMLAGGDAWFWTLVLGGRPGDRIHHVWIHEERVVRVLELPIDGPHWRTYSRQTLPTGAEGKWAVEARDTSGVVLARAEFLCAAPS